MAQSRSIGCVTVARVLVHYGVVYQQTIIRTALLQMFDHVSVFVSIILGLGVVHLLGGISLILDARVKTKVYWVHLVWTANMMFLIALVWIGSLVLASNDGPSQGHYFVLLAYSMTIYLMCGLLFPIRGEEITDFRGHFYSNRVRFFSVGLLFVITDAIDGLLEVRTAEFSLNPLQYGTLALYFVLFVIGTRTSSARFHAVVAVVFFLGMLGFLQSITELFPEG